MWFLIILIPIILILLALVHMSSRISREEEQMYIKSIIEDEQPDRLD